MSSLYVKVPWLSQARVRFTSACIAFLFIVIMLLMLYNPSTGFLLRSNEKPAELAASDDLERVINAVESVSQYFVDYPLSDSDFGEMGRRVQILLEWIQDSEDMHSNSPTFDLISEQIETLSLSMFPFLENPSRPNDPTYFKNLRKSYTPGSKGIVIPTGMNTYRYACHLVTCLREVLHSELPIEIAYAGDKDLPSSYRERITSLASNINTIDVTRIFDDTTLNLEEGRWAIKPFAMLASTFEQVVLIDADAVFVQRPEVLFDNYHGYQETGTLLFHDRLLWQNVFKDRHKWWREEMKHQEPSATLLKSLVYTEGYAEEGDSGVVVLDKGRTPVLLALLHICWQNMQSVRQAYTYRMGYGDKESWWFGLELSAVPFTFEDHYGAVIGHLFEERGETKVCGFTIAHVDEADRLIWYNGSLLKNKAISATEFEVPTRWMVDGKWEKGNTKADLSCMKGSQARVIGEENQKILEDSVAAAKRVDQKIADLVHI